ncbi:hypothetical protein JCM30471_22190 [Desulfuromonas carbonis]
MKCPKCGFTSFDYLDSCKKCGGDLAAFKAKHGLRSLLFPGQGRSGGDTPILPEEAATPEEALMTEASDATDFGFGFMDEEVQAPAVADTTSEEALFLDTEEESVAGGTITPPEDFDLDSAGESELFAADEDLSSFDDPSALAFEEGDDATELLESDLDLPSWDELGEEEPAAKKSAGDKEPPDPFDDREPALARQAPGETSGQPLAEQADSWWEVGEPVAVLPAAAEDLTLLQPLTEGGETADSWSLQDETPVVPAEPEPFSEADETLPPAPLVQRLGALLADLLLLGGIAAIFLLLGQRLLGPQQAGFFPDLELLLRSSTPYFLLLFLACFGYFTGFHLLLGQTPGKMLFAIGVESLAGTALSPSQAFLRSAGGLLALCLGGLGYASILFAGDSRGWNDRLAGTRVVSLGNQAPEIRIERTPPERSEGG